MPNFKFRCSNCNSNLGFYSYTLLKHKLGSPRIQCYNCNSIMHTEKLLWRDMSTHQKGVFYFAYFLKIFTNIYLHVLSIAIVFLGNYVFDLRIENDGFSKQIVIVLSISIILSLLIMLALLSKVFKRMKMIELKHDKKDFYLGDFF